MTPCKICGNINRYNCGRSCHSKRVESLEELLRELLACGEQHQTAGYVVLQVPMVLIVAIEKELEWQQ